MKTTTALLEYFVPGVLAIFGLVMFVFAALGVPPDAIFRGARALFDSTPGAQAVLALLASSAAYVLGMLSSDICGRLIKDIVRSRQRDTLVSSLRRAEVAGANDVGGLDVNTILRAATGDGAGKGVRDMAGVLRSSSRLTSEAVDKQLQFHTEHARMLRAVVLPLAIVGFAALFYVVRFYPDRWWFGAFALIAAGVLVYAAVDSYGYRQELLINTSMDHLIASSRKGRAPSKARGPSASGRIVGTDWANENPYPLDFESAHESGKPHRSVHVEVMNDEGSFLVWTRADGRLELPGGHVEWFGDQSESTDHAAARELLEEVGCPPDAVEAHVDTLRRKLVRIGTYLNRSKAGKNNEWVDVFTVESTDLPRVALSRLDADVLSTEGNAKATWMQLEGIRRVAFANPLGVNSSLALLLARRRGETGLPSASERGAAASEGRTTSSGV